MPKYLSENSRFAQYDLDNDGTVTDEEIAHAKDMLELELREEKADAQKRMASATCTVDTRKKARIFSKSE